MLQILRANTFEIDDPDIAVEDILGQIDFDDLKENSVGIVGCCLEFLQNGTVKALSDQLPFDIIGCTTDISDLCGTADEFQLSLMVLSSDEARFSCGVTESLVDDADKKIQDVYRTTASALSGEPSFGILFAAFMLTVSGDAQLKAMDQASGNIPLFGTVTEDYTDGIRDPRTIYNGDDYGDRLVLLLVSGDIEPQFFFTALPERCFLKQKAIITASQGNLLIEVNNMPALAYLESLGLTKDGQISSVPSIPLSIDVGDGGSPVARAILAVTPEGFVVCGGEMPEQAVLGVGSIEIEDVLTTAEDFAKKISSSGKNTGALIFSCLSRNMALGPLPMSEVERIQSVLGDTIPYLFMYSAGEMYPEIKGDKTYNKAHNDSIIACVF